MTYRVRSHLCSGRGYASALFGPLPSQPTCFPFGHGVSATFTISAMTELTLYDGLLSLIIPVLPSTFDFFVARSLKPFVPSIDHFHCLLVARRTQLSLLRRDRAWRGSETILSIHSIDLVSIKRRSRRTVAFSDCGPRDLARVLYIGRAWNRSGKAPRRFPRLSKPEMP